MANSRTLFEAVARAGVKRIVHVSTRTRHRILLIPTSGAQIEQILTELGVSHAIVRPGILFGGDGV